MTVELSTQERGLISDAARVMMAKLNEDIADLYGRNPDNTPFWTEQMTAAKNMHEIWGNIADKLALIQ